MVVMPLGKQWLPVCDDQDATEDASDIASGDDAVVMVVPMICIGLEAIDLVLTSDSGLSAFRTRHQPGLLDEIGREWLPLRWRRKAEMPAATSKARFKRGRHFHNIFSLRDENNVKD